MTEATIIKFDFNGIELSLRMDQWTAEAYGEAMLNVFMNDPPLGLIESGIASAVSLVYLAYCSYCEMNEMPIIYNGNDFIPVIIHKLSTPEGEKELLKISDEYLKQQQNG